VTHRLSLAAICALAVGACGGGTGTTPTPPPPPPPPPPSTVDRVVVTPATVSIERGGQGALIAAVIGVQGDTLATPVVWASANNAVVTVSPTGNIVAIAPGGPVAVTATVEGKVGTAQVTVTPSAVARVIISPDSIAIQRDSTRALTVRLEDGAGGVITGRTVEWRSINPIVAQVSQTGEVLGLNFGITSVIATAEGRSDTAKVVVLPPPDKTALVIVRSRLAYTVEVLLDGNSRAQLPGNGVLELAVPNDRSVQVGWALIAPTDAGVTLGEMVSDTFPTMAAPTTGQEFLVTATLSTGQRYFDPVLTNTVTSTVIDFPTRLTAVQCPCVAPSGQQGPTRGFGLWLLTPSSTMVLYRRTDFAKTGPSIVVPVPSVDVDPQTGEWVYIINQYP
jgi:hypothetical protein